MTTVKSNGTPISLHGPPPETGRAAPDFVLVDKDMNEVTLKTFKGKAKILYTVPSLDTPVCSISVKRFNELLKDEPGIAVCSISADLPFALRRFCTTQAASHVVPLSLVRSKKFAEDYGVLITGGRLAGLTARAIFVLDADDRVVYTEVVEDISREPDYAAAASAAQSCLL